jgi:hypothetical protein
MSRRRVPAVDPTKPRRCAREPLARTEAGRWWLINISPKLDKVVQAAANRYRAQITTGKDRERLWALAKTLTDAHADYEHRAAGRTILVLRLTPIDDS